MVVVNCGSMPDTLLESELFGYKAGAFTDARRDRMGRFELANGGTLFLDEIADVSPALQAKLLRVLQERVVDPLGGSRSVKVDVRVIAASNRNLSEMVTAKAFRLDLFYRLNVIKILVPPLRARLEDLPLLVDAFVARLNRIGARAIEGVAPEVMNILLAHDFPGNVRELQNILEHASILCRGGVILPRCLPDYLQGAPPVGPGAAGPEDAMDALQKSLLLCALERHHGNRRAAAEELGIHPTTLWRRAQKLGVNLPEEDGRSSHHP
jgi:transcriptional regulator with PAS, ATPase and Fis domain